MKDNRTDVEWAIDKVVWAVIIIGFTICGLVFLTNMIAKGGI